MTNLESAIAGVRELFDGYAAAFTKADDLLFASLWDEAAVEMSPDVPALFGRQAIRGAMREALRAKSWEITLNTEEIKASADYAFARGTMVAATTPSGGGAAAYIDAKFLSVFKRQDDGSWKIFRHCYNGNVPTREWGDGSATQTRAER